MKPTYTRWRRELAYSESLALRLIGHRRHQPMRPPAVEEFFEWRLAIWRRNARRNRKETNKKETS